MALLWLATSLSVCLYVCICLYFSLDTQKELEGHEGRSLRSDVCLSVSLYVCWSAYLSVYQPVFLSGCLSVRLSVYMSVCLYLL